MSLKKAKEFLEYLIKNKELQKKMSGFSQEEFETARKELQKKKKLSDDMLKKISGGYVCQGFTFH